MGFVGSLIVIRPGYLDFNLATLAALGTGFFYGIYLVITRKLHSTDSPLLTLLLTGVVGAIIASFLFQLFGLLRLLINGFGWVLWVFLHAWDIFV